MVAVAVLSAKGSPGATTAALALSAVWPEVYPDRRILLAECDPAGGDIASGYLRGTLDASRGVIGLAAQRAADPVAAVWEQVLSLDDDARRLLLPGLTEPSQAAAVGTAWSTLATALDGLARQTPPVDVLIDLGRMRTAHEPVVLRQRADWVLLTCGSTLPAVVAARGAARELRTSGGDSGPSRPAVLVIGGGPYTASEIGKALDLPVIGTLPHDAASAAVFAAGTGAGRRFARSPLIRSARILAAALLDGGSDQAPELADPPNAEQAGVTCG